MIRREQEPLSEHTTFRIGGAAAFYLAPESEDEVREALAFAGEKGLPHYLIGRGSNLLCSDEGYDGVIIEIGKGLEQISIEWTFPEQASPEHLSPERPDGEPAPARAGGIVTAQAGVSLSSLAARLAKEGLTGFEFAGGIPGTLGGAIAMNAGAYGGEIKDCILSARVLTEQGEIRTLDREELELGYRTSVIQRESAIVLSGTFAFQRGDTEKIQETMRELNQRRRDKQPLEYPSAGSTFKRPEGHFAGKLIEDAGLRGYRVGDAQVSEKHCGFVVNRGRATAADVYRLIRDVQKKVWDEFQVKLEPEVRMIGNFGE